MSNNTDDEKRKKKLDDMIRKMLDEGKEHSAEGTELTLSDQQSQDLCDYIVKKYAIDHAICNPASSLIKKSTKHISEAFSNNDCRFITTSVAEKKMNIDPADADLNLSDLKEFYLRNNMKDYKFSDVLSPGAIEQYWGNRPHQREIIKWRWNNGLAFMDYKERVITYLSHVVFLNQEEKALDEITAAMDIQSAILVLKSDFTTLSHHEIMKRIHPTTREVITDFASGRLNLNKIAKDAIWRNYLATKTEAELDDQFEKDSKE
jgi:hypothetical protein